MGAVRMGRMVPLAERFDVPRWRVFFSPGSIFLEGLRMVLWRRVCIMA